MRKIITAGELGPEVGDVPAGHGLAVPWVGVLGIAANPTTIGTATDRGTMQVHLIGLGTQ